MGGERDGDEEVVDVLGEEVVERGLVETGEPGGGDGTVRVAGAGDDEAVVFFAGRGRTGAGGVGDYVHAHCVGNAGDFAELGLLLELGRVGTWFYLACRCCHSRARQDVGRRGLGRTGGRLDYRLCPNCAVVARSGGGSSDGSGQGQ